jgi:hypothetical protein
LIKDHREKKTHSKQLNTLEETAQRVLPFLALFDGSNFLARLGVN